MALARPKYFIPVHVEYRQLISHSEKAKSMEYTVTETSVEIEDSYQMCTKKEMYEYLIRIAKQPRRYNLSDVVLETLSIIAYKQPVTRQEIEKIRGVKSDHAVNKLIEYNLVEEVGRLDVPGRPILFGTTEEFLRRFSVQSVDELPGITPEKVEDFKAEAEDEIQLKLNL